MFEYLWRKWIARNSARIRVQSQGPTRQQPRVQRQTPRLECLEDRNLLSATLAEFPLATVNTALSGIASGSDGNIWFTENKTGQIGTLNLATHVITEFPLPSSSSGPMGIAAGFNGNLWFTEFGANKIGEINPVTHVITEFAIPTASSGATAIAAGPDGNLWFTEFNASKIGQINPATGAITEFATTTSGSGPYAIAVGPDGNLWFTEFGAGNIGAINPIAHDFVEIATPTGGSGPLGITAGANGNLWFTELTAGQIGQVSPTTGGITEMALPTSGSGPYGISAGPDGNIWFAESSGSQIGEFNFTSGAITETATPTLTSSPVGIAPGAGGSLWFTESAGNRIGEVFVPPVVTAAPISAAITEGQSASFTAAATGLAAPSVVWLVSTNGGATFTPLANGGVYSGVTTKTLTITGALAAMNGYQYEAYFSNGVTSTITSPATLAVKPLLIISPAALPQGVAGINFNQTIAVIGSTTPFGLFAVNAFNPGATGLTLGSVTTNSVNGTITINGTPSAAGTVTFTVSVANTAGNTLTQTLAININPALSIATASLPNATAGATYNRLITVIGGLKPYATFTVTGFSGGTTGLAAGAITAQPAAGTFTVSGVPTAAGTVTFTVNVTDATGTALSKTYTFDVSPPLVITPSLPQGTAGVGYHQTATVSGGAMPYMTFSISHFSAGATGLTIANIALDPASETVTIAGTPAAAGAIAFTVNVVDANGAPLNKTYSIAINPVLTATPALPQGTAGTAYHQTIAISGGSLPFPVFSVTGFDGGSTGLTADAITVNAAVGKFVINGLPTAAGTIAFTINVTDAVGGSLTKTYAVAINQPLAVSDLTATLWTAGAPGFNGVLSVGGGSLPFSIVSATGLPTGLTAIVNGNAIAFAGVPTTAATYANGSITLHDAAGASVTKTFAITISPALAIGNPTVTQWTAGRSGFTGVLAVGGGSGALSIAGATGLPSGLAVVLNGNTIAFTGTPTTAATFTASVTFRDAVGASLTKTFSVTINPPPAIGNLSTAQWTAGIAGYTGAMSLSGGTKTLAITNISGLPTGVTATISGNTVRLSGTPSAAKTFAGSITITDAAGASVTKTFTITINPPLSAATTSLPASKMALMYTATVQTKGGTGAVTFALTSGSLPPGMRLGGNGVISGISRGFGAFTFTVTATDAVGSTFTEKLTLSLSFR